MWATCEQDVSKMFWSRWQDQAIVSHRYEWRLHVYPGCWLLLQARVRIFHTDFCSLFTSWITLVSSGVVCGTLVGLGRRPSFISLRFMKLSFLCAQLANVLYDSNRCANVAKTPSQLQAYCVTSSSGAGVWRTSGGVGGGLARFELMHEQWHLRSAVCVLLANGVGKFWHRIIVYFCIRHSATIVIAFLMKQYVCWLCDTTQRMSKLASVYHFDQFCTKKNSVCPFIHHNCAVWSASVSSLFNAKPPDGGLLHLLERSVP